MTATSPRRARLRQVGIAATVVLVIALVVTALRSGDDEPERAPLLPTSTRADLSGVSLPGVEGTTTSSVPPAEGDVFIRGVVRTPAGQVVPGATVRAEWFRIDPPGVVEVATDAEGRFEIPNVAGGAWRIRAWRTPDFATLEVRNEFLTRDAEFETELPVEEVAPYSVTWDIEPDPPIIDHNATLVAVFSERTVDIEGRVVTTPLNGLDVSFSSDGAWLIVQGDADAVTDEGGQVQWVVRCESAGKHPIDLASVVVTHRPDIAACIPITATSTTTTEAPPEPPPTTAPPAA